MAKTTTTTSVYEVRSQTSGQRIRVNERVFKKFQKINGRVVRTELTPEVRDIHGRAYKRAGLGFRCASSGELYEIVEQAPSIRKESA